ncbi:hypothetical protein ABG067_000884 [Albugo candida]
MSSTESRNLDPIAPQMLSEVSFERIIEEFFALTKETPDRFDLQEFSRIRQSVETIIIQQKDHATFVMFCNVWHSILCEHKAEYVLQSTWPLLQEFVCLAAAHLYFGATDKARNILGECVSLYKSTKQTNELLLNDAKKLLFKCVRFQDRLEQLTNRHKRFNPPPNVTARMLIEAEGLIVIAPLSIPLLIIQASSLLRLKRYRDCCLLLKEKSMVKLDPQLTLYYAQALDCCCLAEEATNVVTTFLHSVPSDDHTVVELRRFQKFDFLRSEARKALAENDYSTAVSYLTQCIILRNHHNDKELASIYFERGRANLLKNDLKSALRDLNGACKLNPDDQHYWLLLQTAKLKWIMIQTHEIWLTTNSSQGIQQPSKKRNRKRQRNGIQKTKRQRTQKSRIFISPEESINAQYFQSARLQLLDEMQQAGYDKYSLPTAFGKSGKECSNGQEMGEGIQEQHHDDDGDDAHSSAIVGQDDVVILDLFEANGSENAVLLPKTEPEGEMSVEIDTVQETFTKVADAIDPPSYLQQDRSIIKFWRQRYQLFNRYDEGIEMDYESWYSVTPQAIAEHIAERVRCGTVVDLFAGCGGNTIQLALTCHHVIAVEIDPDRIQKAKHNAKVYGVSDRIEWICGDALQVLSKLQADVIFLSPPWGGLNYNRDLYTLEDMMINESCSGQDLFQLAVKITGNIVYYLPKATSQDELQALVPEQSVSCDKVFLNGHEKVLVAYFGDLVRT